ncbi:MAG: hypothetical protein AAF623_05605 [Planctomycetota bacterium]
MKRYFILAACAAMFSLGNLSATLAQETTDQKKEETKTAEPFDVTVCDGKLSFKADGNWKMVPPKSRILEAELKIPRTGDDEADGRLTIMGAGGSVEANIQRWQMQFKQPDGSATSEKTKVVKEEVDDQEVNFVDITGTFLDSPGGPFSGRPKVEREDYRMLAAIIATKSNGQYFLKLYGPKATIDKNAKEFKEMVKSMTTN